MNPPRLLRRLFCSILSKMNDTTLSKTVGEQGGRYVVDAQNRPVAVLLTLEEYEHYLDLLDDEADSQDQDLHVRLDRAATQPETARLSLHEYLRQRPPTDAAIPD